MLSYSLGERNILNPAHDVFISFNTLGKLVGRDYLKDRDIGTSVFIYCGAEILALDRYIILSQ